MIDIRSLSPEALRAGETYQKIKTEYEDRFGTPEFTAMKQEIKDRAKELRLPAMFVNEQLSVMEKTIKQEIKAAAAAKLQERMLQMQMPITTKFTMPTEWIKQADGSEVESDRFPFKSLVCTGWIADDSGVYRENAKTGAREYACHHPILVSGRIINARTIREKVEISFLRDGSWSTRRYDRETIANSSKIVGALAPDRIDVDSGTAQALVSYLSNLEIMNEDAIPIQRAIDKLGWYQGDFVPYSEDLIYDGPRNDNILTNSIRKSGSYDTWLETIKRMRKSPELAMRAPIVASFASPLCHLLSTGTSFILNIYGLTSGGKSVTLQAAASVWGDPYISPEGTAEDCDIQLDQAAIQAGGQAKQRELLKRDMALADGRGVTGNDRFIGHYRSTLNALERRAHILNHLPMILDDHNKSDLTGEDMEKFIYDIADGQGKNRLTKDTSGRESFSWQLFVITSGESSLREMATKGGAINRLLEVSYSGDTMMTKEEGAMYGSTFEKNFGWAGPEFIKAIKEIGANKIREIYDKYMKLISEKGGAGVIGKQAQQVALLLTADELAEQIIFKDGCRLSVEECLGIMATIDQVSDGQRAYEYLLNRYTAEPDRCNYDAKDNKAKWGFKKKINGKEYICWNRTALKEIMEEGGYRVTQLQAWLVKQGFTLPDLGERGKAFRDPRQQVNWCIPIRMDTIKEEIETEPEIQTDNKGMEMPPKIAGQIVEPGQGFRLEPTEQMCFVTQDYTGGAGVVTQ